jgi:alanine-synthesizing transaminase
VGLVLRQTLHTLISRLRRAISNWYKNRFDVAIDAETEAIVTIGSKEGLANLAQAVP